MTWREGHLLALEKGRHRRELYPGRRGCVACRPCWRDIAAPDRPQARPRSSCRAAPLFPLAYGAEAVARLTGKEPFLTADALRMSRYHMFFSSAKAKARTGLSPRGPMREGLADALAWFGAQRISAMIAGIAVRLSAAGDLALSAAGPRRLLADCASATTATSRRSPPHWPSVVAVVPARNEADVIQHSIGSLLAQDYPGDFRVILVDDQPTTAPAICARGAGHSDRLTVLTGAPRPPGWTGKLWAMQQGVDAAPRRFAPEFLWFTDADIAHAPDNLRRLVARAEDGGLVLVSLMARLHCATAAEHFLIPAFVFFFDMLFPVRRGERSAPQRSRRRRAAACWRGATRWKRPAASTPSATTSSTIARWRRAMKAQGPIWLGLTDRAV